MRAVDLIAAARSAIRQKTPYMMAAVHGLVFYPTEEAETLFVTPGLVAAYNPRFIEGLLKEAEQEAGIANSRPTAISKVGFCLLHETQHPLRKHFERQGDRDPDTWNEAGDLPINTDTKAMGWIPPAIALFPKKLGLPEGLTTEAYYELLLKKKKEQAAKKGQTGSGKGADVGSRQSSGGVCAGQCGGAAGHPAQADLEKRIDQEVGRSPVDRERISRQVAQDIINHVKQSGRGSVPGSLSEWAEFALTPPKVPWEKELAHSLRSTCGRLESGEQDYSRARISKRSYTRGVLLPGMVSYQPEGVVILDVSGSMDLETDIRIGLRETAGVLLTLGVPRIWFMQADTEVSAEPRYVQVTDLRKMQILGRGGTSFTAALNRAVQLRPRPRFAIYFTDGDGYVTEAPPEGLHVIWAITPGGVKPSCGWGKVIWIKE